MLELVRSAMVARRAQALAVAVLALAADAGGPATRCRCHIPYAVLGS